MLSVGRRLAAVAVIALVAGCSPPTDSNSADSADGAGAAITVLASFYPLQYVTEQVLGDRGQVRNLTPSGGEPHELELTARDVGALADASLVVYLAGFQPAVDDALEAVDGDTEALDVSGAARLTRENDPHFWLDPTRLADVADAVADRLAEVSPADADVFRSRAAAVRAELARLDRELAAGLATCTSRDLVTGHQAFGYLAERYRLTQVGVAGLTPEAEPDGGTLAELTEYVRSHSVRTIYYETLVSPDVARTLAGATGAATAVLDPIEGLSETSAAGDYLALMRANLATLRAGQPCS